ncbi:MAG: GNAT family N-acetyltransferase [Candidatus Thorarchaeota archaeon]|nr:GNAT family N-acetyltransferase [Candidatus Thorarchaeota archaeon]
MIEQVDENNIKDVLEIIGEFPMHNIILIADVTQLKDWCDVRLIRREGEIRGVFALYQDLDFLAGAFWTHSDDALRSLVENYGEILRGAKMIFICTEKQLEILRAVTSEVEALKERQMVMDDPSMLECEEIAPTVRLTMDDAEELRELYRICDTPAWTPNALNLGPFFGVKDQEGKIVSVAGVHFVTEYGAEIGNVATHPEHRRKGYAACCVAAATKELLKGSARVLLHFFEDNNAAQKLYEKMGFVYSDADPVYFTKATMY